MGWAARAIRRPKRRSNGLLGEWIQQEYDTVNAPDWSGNGNHGTITTAVWAAGRKPNQRALLFDDSDVVNCGTSNSLVFGNGTTDSPFSIEMWFNTPDMTTKALVGKFTALNNAEYLLSLSAADKIQFTLNDASASAYIGRLYNTALTSLQNTWVHVVATYDGSRANAGCRIYLNGVRVDDTNNTTGSYTAMEDKNLALKIGNYASTYFSGKIGLVRVYNRALSAREVLENYYDRRRRFVSL